MKQIKKVKYYIAALTVGVSLMLSCEKSFLEVEPIGQLSTELKTTDDALLALNGVYNAIITLENFNSYWPIVAMWSDDTQAHPDISALNQIHDFVVSPDSGPVSRIWRRTYEAIFRANIVIENTPNIEGDEGLKSRFIGEAQFIRGIMMMRLASYWGTAPLVDKVLPLDELEVPNSTPQLLWQQAIDDLIAASNALPVAHEGSDLGRATKGAAIGYLGKAYMFNNRWQDAIDQFELVDGLSYKLLDNFSDVFLVDNSEESLFEIQFTVGGGVGTGSENSTASHANTILPPNSSGFGGGGGWGFLQPLDDLVDEFEDGDLRKQATVFLEGDEFEGIEFAGNTIGVWHIGIAKFTYGTNVDEDGGLLDGPHNWVWLRYADILLMHAEALIELNQVDDALDKINEVRLRAGGILPLENLTQAQARDAVRHERRVELAFEGTRGLDIRRWGIAADVSHSNFEVGTHELLPIPQSELDVNNNLDQNFGYPE